MAHSCTLARLKPCVRTAGRLADFLALMLPAVLLAVLAAPACLLAQTNQPPVTGPVNPASGAGSAQRVFEASYTDPNGLGDLHLMSILFNTSVSTANACLIEYDQSTQLFYLMDDSGTTLTGGVPPLTSAFLANSQCTVNLTSTHIADSGQYRFVQQISIDFNPTFNGLKNVYTYASDNGGLSSGWVKNGTWLVDEAPNRTSVTPSGYGLAQTFVARYSDPDGYGDLNTVQLNFATSVSQTVNACSIIYNVAADKLYLLDDAGATQLGGVTPGSGTTIANSQCILDTSRSSVAKSGTDLSMTAPLSFTAAFKGVHTIYALSTDNEGLTGTNYGVGSWIVGFPPAVIGVTPNSGAGDNQTFGAQYADPDGYSDLDHVNVLFSSTSPANSCYIVYSITSNTLSLIDDSGTAPLAALAPGTATTVSNSQCTLNYAGSSVSGNDTTLSLAVSLSFKPAFVGARGIYLYAADRTGLLANWTAVGAWTVLGGCTYSLSPASQSVGPDGITSATTVTASAATCGWRATANNAFITFPAGNTGAGSGLLRYTVSANPDITPRTGTFTVMDQTFTVNQAGAPCTYSFSPSTQSVAAAGGSLTVAVMASNPACAWTAVSNAGFINITGGAGGTGNGTVSYSVAANVGPDRTGTLTIGGQTFSVTQSNGCTYSLNPAGQSFGAAGGAGSVSVTASSATCPWTAASNDSFVSLAGGASGTGNGTVNYGVNANAGPARTGTLTIAGQTFTVSQAGGCTYALGASGQDFSPAGGSGTVDVTPSSPACAWTATTSASFVTITGGASGVGNGTVSYSISPNPDTMPRTGGITIAGQTYTVVQAAAPNPLPVIASLSPWFATAGSGPFPLTVNGSSFVSGSQVVWNGAPLPTTFVSPTKLYLVIAAANIATAGAAQVAVVNPAPGGGTSMAVSFPIAASGAPLVSTGGVIGAASYLPANAPNAGLTPGSFAAVFGANLATGTAVVGPGEPLPWPTSLLGTAVTVAGIPATLFFVSPTQIDFVIPWATPNGPQQVIITTPNGTAPPVTIHIQRSAPGIFTLSSTGKGPAAAINIPVSNPGNWSVNGFTKAAKRGDYVELFGTGIDMVQNPPPDGQLPDPTKTVATGTVTVILGGKTITPDYVGLVGIGLYQLNVKIPLDITQDCLVAGQVIANGIPSNSFTLSIADSGDCSSTPGAADIMPPGSRYLSAQLLPAANSNGTGDRFQATAIHLSANRLQLTGSEPPGVGGCVVNYGDAAPGVNWIEVSESLDAGNLTLQGPNFGITVIKQAREGFWPYPPGGGGTFSIDPGAWTLSGSGGADVGAFGPVSLFIPGHLAVTSLGVANGAIERTQNFTPAWTCPSGNDASRVAATIRSVDPARNLSTALTCTALCSAGTITIPPNWLTQLIASAAGAGTVELRFLPDASKTPAISATGLDAGRFTWSDRVSQDGITIK